MSANASPCYMYRACKELSQSPKRESGPTIALTWEKRQSTSDLVGSLDISRFSRHALTWTSVRGV